jgi:hypothetical protein
LFNVVAATGDLTVSVAQRWTGVPQAPLTVTQYKPASPRVGELIVRQWLVSESGEPSLVHA